MTPIPSIHIVRVNMHCQDIEHTYSFFTGLKSAEARKLECLNEQQIKFYWYCDNVVNPLCS